MPGRITTQGHIDQFRVFGGLAVVYIEVKQVGSCDERLNAVAQLIAEADGMYLRQHQCPILTFFYIDNSM